MSKLYFKVASDWQEVVRLRNEISKLESQIKSMDANKAPQAVAVLNNQMQQAKHQMNGMITEAAKAGAVMDNDFKSKIYQGSQSVNDFTQKIINQKAVVKDVEADVRRLGESYRSALKNNPLSASGKLSEYTSAKKALDEEKATLFGLTQEQANARLSVKKLRDEYSLYRDESKETIQSNEGVGISLKKAFAVIGGVAAGKELISNIIRVRGEFQAADTAIQTLLGSKEKANALMSQVKEYAKISPLEFSDVTQAAQMMLGFNIEAEKTPQYIRAIGDISMGDSQKFNSLTLAFSQMSAAGKLMGQDLNQMINAGFNPLQQISDTTGKSIATLKDEMSKGAISAEMVQKAFVDATSAGGKFFGMSENASKTINGQLSMMQDAIDSTFNELGEKSEGAIMGGIQLTTKLVENYETVGKILSGLVITYGAYRTAVMLSTIATGKHTIAEVALTNVRVIARRAQMALNASMLANPYVLLAVAIGGLGTAMWALHDGTTAAEKAQRRFNEEKEGAIKKEQNHKQKLEELISAIQNEYTSSLDRVKAMDLIKANYPSLFQKYIDEKGHIRDLTGLWKEYNEESSKGKVAENRGKYTNSKSVIDDYQKVIGLWNKFGKDPNFHKNDLSTDEKALANRYKNETLSTLKSKLNEERNILIDYQKDVRSDELAQWQLDLKKKTNVQIKSELDEMKRIQQARKGNPHYSLNVGVGSLKGATTDLELQQRISVLDSEYKIKLRENSSYKKDYEKAQKDWEDAKKALSAIEKDKAKFTSKQYEEAKDLKETTEKKYKDLGGITGSSLTKQDNQADKLREQQEKYNLLLNKQKLEQIRAEEDLQMQVSQSKIDTMSDGFNKEQAQRNLNNKKEIQSLERQKEDAIRAIIQAEKEKFDAQEDIKAQQRKGYVKQSFDTSTVDTSKAGSSWDKIIRNTETKQVLDEWQKREDSMNEYLLKYGTFSQKKEAIDKKYQDAINQETDIGSKNMLQKEWDEALSSLEMDKLKQEINWELIFGDLSKVSKKSLSEVKQQLKTFKSSSEYKDMSVDQKKVIDDALNDIQTTLIDKGGLLGDLPEQLDALRIAQKELNDAQEEYNDAIKHGTDAEKEAALKKKNNAEKNVQNAEVNVTKSADKTSQNLITLADTITGLGNTSEMSLSQIGSLASGLIDTFTDAGSKIGGIVGAAFSLLDVIDKQGIDGFVENVFSSVFKAAGSIWDTITFGAFSKITGSGESDKNLEKDIEYLTQSNQDLKNSLDNLSEKMDKASVADANDIYSIQKENILKQEANLREAMQRSGAAYSNGFWGIGGSHSSNNKIDKGLSTSEWSRISEIVGKSVSNAGQFFQLSSEQMAKLAEEDTTLYSKIKDLANNGYRDAAQYMDEYISYYKQLEELESAYNEKLTNTSFDSIRSDFKNALLDMESDAEDFAGNFEKMMQNAIVESLMTKKYDALIQGWYKEFAKAMEGDSKIDESEQKKLQDRWNSITNQALAERDALKDAMGWEIDKSSSQDSTKRGFGTEMTHEDAGELSGRFTALQISGEETKNQNILQTQSLNLLTMKSEDILRVSSEIKDIADETRDLIANSYLELVQISENTGAIIKPIQQMQKDMAEVKKNTSKL